MCGRYASYRQAQDLADAFDVDDVTEAARAVPPSYNVAPTQPVRIVLDRAGNEDVPARREMHAARWGLVPAWAKDTKVGYKMINARLESLEDRPAFRASLERRRCIVPADGYYEWQRRDGSRKPYYIHGEGSEPIALAGLYAFWRDPERGDDDPDRWVLSTTIVTTAARGPLARLHDRVPVVVEPSAVAGWLDPGLKRGDRAVRLLTGSGPHLTFHEVSDKVNRTTVDEPGLIAPR
jgi:putative SOS response-associated peptidase YedK